MSRGYFDMKTMEELYYGKGQHLLRSNDLYIAKDDMLTSSTNGVYNATYGAMVWAQFNQEANIFGALPKYPWESDGWRVLSGAAGTSADGGVSEGGAIPATIKPVWFEISTKPKTIAHSFNVSELQEFEAVTGSSDSVGSMEHLRQVMAAKHREAINEQLARDVDDLSSTRIESIDRVCSNNDEVTNAGITAGDSDIYSIDRDEKAGWWDAFVDHGTTVDRFLEETHIRGLLDNVGELGGNTNLFVTGYDTYSSIQGLFESAVRYNPLKEAKMKISVNGIETAEGIDVGMTFSTLYGIPLLRSADVAKDTISRLYALDTTDPEGFGLPRLGIKVAKPTQYFEGGINAGDPFGINAFANEGVYRTMGELICHRFRSQGKVRDLK